MGNSILNITDSDGDSLKLSKGTNRIYVEVTFGGDHAIMELKPEDAKRVVDYLKRFIKQEKKNDKMDSK